jgi:hypothetical protein
MPGLALRYVLEWALEPHSLWLGVHGTLYFFLGWSIMGRDGWGAERPGPNNNAPTGVKDASLGPGARGCELHIAICSSHV